MKIKFNDKLANNKNYILIRRYFCFIKVQQQLYIEKCNNDGDLNHKKEEIRQSKTTIKPINNKYLYKSDLARAASILKSNTKNDIPHR